MKTKIGTIERIVCFVALVICLSIILTFAFGRINTVKADDGNDIIPITREEGSGTRGSFIALTNLENRNILGELEDETSDKVAVVGSSGEMIQQTALTENGIGYVSYAVAKDNSDVKMLAVEGITPSIENIKNNTYPLTRSFNLVYNGELTDIEKDFLQYVKSEGQGHIADYCVPARNEGIFLPNNAEGTLRISGSTSMSVMVRALAADYMEVNPKAKVEVVTSDSEAGIMDVMEGTSNFGMVSRNLRSYEENVISAERIGKDAIAIIVNPENEVEDITVSQLKRIYDKSMTSWEYLNVYK